MAEAATADERLVTVSIAIGCDDRLRDYEAVVIPLQLSQLHLP